MEKDQQAQLTISWDRESGQVNYNLTGLSHPEAQRLLQFILQDNLEHALVEAQGHHHHEGEPHPPEKEEIKDDH